jgi:hypothetical protein
LRLRERAVSGARFGAIVVEDYPGCVMISGRESMARILKNKRENYEIQLLINTGD